MAGTATSGRSKAGLIVTIVVLALTLIAVGTVAWLGTRPAQDQATDTPATSEETPAEQQTETPADEEETSPTLDPTKTSTISIDSMGIVVAYTKGIPGFEFQVKRNGQGTQYVEFSSPQLVGTKCTDDVGLFATIIRNPKTEDEQTVDQSTKIGDDTYGLVLAEDICTNDAALLKKYQTAFSEGLSFLKVIE